MNKLLFFIITVIGMLFSVTASAMCAGGFAYSKASDGWYFGGSFGGRKIADADMGSFHVLTGAGSNISNIPCAGVEAYAADKFHVFMGGNIIPDADPATFEFVDQGYTRDAHHVYYVGNVLKDADPGTFRQAMPDSSAAMPVHGASRFFEDAGHVYFIGSIVKGADSVMFAVYGLTEYPGTYLAHDSKHVFFGEKLVAGAEPKDVKVLGREYWSSNGQVFANEKPIAGADPTTFHVTANPVSEAEDSAHYFCADQSFAKSDCTPVENLGLNCKGFALANCRR